MQWSGGRAVDSAGLSRVARLVAETGDHVLALRATLADELTRDRAGAQATADGTAHERLVVGLTSLFPRIPVVSEEDDRHDPDRAGLYWLIDPIDGTASWSGGFDGFVCQAALIGEGIPVFGVIHAPVRGMTWTAWRGAGADLNGKRLPRIDPTEPTDEEIVIIDNYPRPQGVCARVMGWLGSDRYLESGSIGLKGALVASGSADLFLKDVVVRDWDVAPALALMTEVGGTVLRSTGAPYELNGNYAKPEGVVFARTAGLARRVTQWLADGV